MNKNIIMVAWGMLTASIAFANTEWVRVEENDFSLDAKSQMQVDLSQMSEYHLLEVDSDAVSFDSELRLILDDTPNILGLHYLTTDGVDLRFQYADLLKGVSLMKMSGREVTKLKIDSTFSHQSGGLVMMSYLYNGIMNTYKNYPVYLSRSNNQWIVKNSDGINFSKLFLRANKLMGTVIGIQEVIPQS